MQLVGGEASGVEDATKRSWRDVAGVHWHVRKTAVGTFVDCMGAALACKRKSGTLKRPGEHARVDDWRSWHGRYAAFGDTATSLSGVRVGRWNIQAFVAAVVD